MPGPTDLSPPAAGPDQGAATGAAALDAARRRVEAARVAFDAGDYDRILEGAEAAVAVLRGADAPRLAGELVLICGNVHLERGAYDAAAVAFTDAQGLFRTAGAAIDLARARHNLGLVCWRVGDLAGARAELQAAADVFTEHADARGTGNCYNSLGLVAEEEGDLGAALAWYAEALSLLRRVGADVFVANVLANIAGVHEKQGDLPRARALQEEALGLRRGAGHRRGVVGSQVELARIALVAGDLAGAAAAITDGRREAEALGLRKHLVDLDGLDARLAAARGAWEDAWRAEVRAGAGRLELASAETARRISALQARAEVETARTEARRRERENAALRVAHEAAEAASRAKGEFLAVMSHEIRTPLTTVVGAGELLAAGPLDPDQRRLVDRLLAAGQALVAVVDQALDLSRIDEGQLELARVPFDAALLLDQLAAVAGASATARGLDFEAVGGPSLGWRLGDVERLRQIGLNLLGNAVKFTERGAVRLRAGGDPAELWLEVEDTGIGIAAADLVVVFEPFVQVDGSTTRRFGGTGLGLAVVRGLVRRMGGRVEARSVPGVGSLFRVVVPVPATPAPERAGAAPGGPHVLLVEDEDEVATIVGAMLELLGCRVSRAASGAAALAAAGATPFDLALVDIHMPEMDGVATARALAEVSPRLRVVGLTGAATRADRARALAAGMSEYLTKPVTLGVLRRVVGR